MKSSVCRERAGECADLARAALHEEERVMLNHIAEVWERLALLEVERSPKFHEMPTLAVH